MAGHFNCQFYKWAGFHMKIETLKLNIIKYKIDLTDIYRIFCPNLIKFLSTAHGSFSKIDMFCHIRQLSTNLKN